MRLSNILILSAAAMMKPVYGALDISGGVFCMGFQYTQQELESARGKNCDFVRRKLSEEKRLAKKKAEDIRLQLDKDREIMRNLRKSEQSRTQSNNLPSYVSLDTYEVAADRTFVRTRLETGERQVSSSTYLVNGPAFKPHLPEVIIPTEWPVTLPQKGEGSTRMFMDEKCDIQYVTQFCDGKYPYICKTPGEQAIKEENDRRGREHLARMGY